jgi:hypothetical protein
MKLRYQILMLICCFIGMWFTLDLAFKRKEHKPQHKIGDIYEYWTNGNEFENSRLIEFGKIIKVGKENYLNNFIYCSTYYIDNKIVNSEVRRIEFVDEDYKFVDEKQLLIDINKECVK